MNAFIVEVANKPGELARVTEIVAARGVNILPSGLASGDRFLIGFLASDEGGSRTALRDAGIPFREIPLVGVTLQDRPGQTAEAGRRLADAGVNIEFVLPVDKSDGRYTVAVGVDNIQAAEKALNDQLATLTFK